jgi:formate hydrogenlyase subunit 3/multisubunit Na+/H+ antiporter MnhD subunit
MRFAAGLIGIIGALAGLALGIKWLSDLHSELAQKVIAKVAEGSSDARQLNALRAATYLLLVCGVVGLVVSVRVMARKGQRWLNALLLLVAGLLPLAWCEKACFGVPMALAGLLALGVRYHTKAEAAPPPYYMPRP